MKYGALMLSMIAILSCFLACSKTPQQHSDKNEDANTTFSQDPQLQKMSIAIQDNPTDATLYAQRGQLLYERENFRQAAQDVEKAIELEPQRPEFYHYLADIYLDGMQSKKAIATLERANTNFPERLQTQLKLTEFYILLKEYDKADELLFSVLQKNPQEAEAYFMLGLMNMEKGVKEDAIHAFEKTVAFDSKLIDAWLLLAELRSENPQLVKQYLRNALAADPQNTEAQMAQANFLASEGNFDEAIEIYKDIGTQNPQHADAHYNMGLCYKLTGDIDKALAEATIAHQIDPVYAEAYALKAVCYQLKNDTTKALEYARQSLSFRDVPLAQEVLENLKEKMK